MALTLSIAAGSPGGPVVVNQTMNYTATVTNTGSSAVTLQSLSINESTESDALISQPNIAPPGAAGTGLPVLAAGGSASYGFQVVFSSPAGPGNSPNAPGGSFPDQRAQTPEAYFMLLAQAAAVDGTGLNILGAGSLTVLALTPMTPFPVPQGGASQFNQGANSNLIAVFA